VATDGLWRQTEFRRLRAGLQDELEAVELPIGCAEATIANETIDGARDGGDRERVERSGSNTCSGTLARCMDKWCIVPSLSNNTAGVERVRGDGVDTFQEVGEEGGDRHPLITLTFSNQPGEQEKSYCTEVFVCRGPV
jgi:hypothetical protein